MVEGLSRQRSPTTADALCADDAAESAAVLGGVGAPRAVAVKKPLLGQDGAAHDGADARPHVLVCYLRPGGDCARSTHLKSAIDMQFLICIRF